MQLIEPTHENAVPMPVGGGHAIAIMPTSMANIRDAGNHSIQTCGA